MNLDDVDKVHAAYRSFRCMRCDNSASCPPLRDAVWIQAWAVAAGQLRQPACTRARTRAGDTHDARCELRQWGRRQLLCLPCTEAALGRELTLDDLEVCGGNAAHVIMQTRAVQAARAAVPVAARKASRLDQFLAELERTAPPEPTHHTIPQTLLKALAEDRDD